MRAELASQPTLPLHIQRTLVTEYPTGRALLGHPDCTARPSQMVRVGRPGLDTPQEVLAAVYEQLLFAEDATHQRLRAALDGPLAHYSARVTPCIRHIVAALLDQAVVQGEIDLEREFARPLAIRTLACLLGWPEDQVSVDQLAAWSSALADVTTGHAARQALPQVQKMAAAFRTLVRTKADQPTDDLTSVLATSPALGSETERVLLLLVVFGAGTSTAITVLTNGLPLLLANQERLAALRADLATDRTTLSRLVNELLRLVTPTQYVRRWARTDLHEGAVSVPAGCPVQIALAEMNKDQECFPNAESLDWQHPRPREHAAFGFGAHACPGAPLARMELRVALEALLALPELRLVSEATHWNDNQNQHRRQGVRVCVTRKEPSDGSAGK